MQHRGTHAGKGCTGDVHAGGAEQACTAGNSGREQIGRAAQGAGRDGQRRPGRTHMQEGKERGLGPAAACRCSAQGIRGLGCLYRDGEGIFGLRAKRRVRARLLI